MAERFEIVEKALLKMLEEKKYSTLRDILITMNPRTWPVFSTAWRKSRSPSCSACFPRSRQRRPLWKWSPRLSSC